DVVGAVDAAGAMQAVAAHAVDAVVGALAPLHLARHVGVDEEPPAAAAVERAAGDRGLPCAEPALVVGAATGAAMLASGGAWNVVQGVSGNREAEGGTAASRAEERAAEKDERDVSGHEMAPMVELRG